MDTGPDSHSRDQHRYKVAIVGSGPAGLSAAAHAASKGVSHVLLERAPHLNDTIFKFQKRKHVMASPELLPLRSDLPFRESAREELLDNWNARVGPGGISVRVGSEVTRISGGRGDFTIGLAGGEELHAEFVVLAIGIQGNLNRLRIPGADLPSVQYQLDDPDEYQGEEIIVIGTGDAGLENALALSANNRVSLVNRTADFPRAKAANAELIEAAIKRGDILHLSNSNPKEIEAGQLVLDTQEGEQRVPFDRIIARIGALPPRTFVESCGVSFPNDSPTAFPQVSETYESGVPGLYIIGALAGYPLIKHCLNQGYEAIEYILGNPVPPADEPVLRQMLARADFPMSPTELVSQIQEKLPIFSVLTKLQIREFLMHSQFHRVQPGEVVFNRGEYSNSFYAILDGAVDVHIDAEGSPALITLESGGFFGEMALVSGRRRSSTVVASSLSLLLEIERNTMLRLLRSEPAIKRAIDAAAVVRQLTQFAGAGISQQMLSEVLASSTVVEFKPNEVLIEEGALDDFVYLVRKGSVTVSVRVAGREIVLAYLPAGKYVGELALLHGDRERRPRSATVRAAVATEAIRVEGRNFRDLLDANPELRHRIYETRTRRISEAEEARQAPGGIEYFLAEAAFTGAGLGAASDVLVIDESICVRCDNCEKACAETHGGISRLDREAGQTFEMLHSPTSCRHCEDPHCMKDCPPDAIHRAPNGEVWIDDQCIGCGNCERNCPYGVIQMAAMPPKKSGLLSWLLFGKGPGPGEDRSPSGLKGRVGAKHAVKCDMCKDISGGPACVRACPTGAAIRVEAERLLELMRRARS